MATRRIVLLAVLILVLPATALAAEGGSGRIEGHLVNGSQGGSSLANLEVLLETYQNNNQVATATAVTDAEGRFVFPGLATGSDYVYQASLTFQETKYVSEAISFAEGETVAVAEIVVYDATDSDENIIVTNSHTIVTVGDGGLSITEVYSFINQGDRSYVGSVAVAEGAKATLTFILPEGAIELEPGSGLMECCVYASGGGFVDSMPFPPGPKQVAYSYWVPNRREEYTLFHSVSYPTDRYDFLVRGEGVTIDSDRLVPDEPVTIEGTTYAHSSAGDLGRGELVVALVTGLPVANTQMVVIWVGVSLGMLVGGFGLYMSLRKRPAGPAPLAVDDLEEERQRLLLVLARMDDDHAAGSIPEASYRERRAEVKARLVELMQRARAGRR